VTADGRPGLVFFYSANAGATVQVDGFLAQVLQRRRNHSTFKLYRVEDRERPDLIRRFGIERTPSLAIVEGKSLRGKLTNPRGCREIEAFLAPWLRRPGEQPAS
jgi:hypothetical protein